MGTEFHRITKLNRFAIELKKENLLKAKVSSIISAAFLQILRIFFRTKKNEEAILNKKNRAAIGNYKKVLLISLNLFFRFYH